MKPIVAIVGRPNVGKSTLFNKLIGERRSIVEDTPGVTRDRIYGDVEWNGRRLMLIDTGGIEPKTDDVILRQMRMQAQIAIDMADVIVFVCDVRFGMVADDREIAVMLNKSGKPVIPAVNKCDSIGAPPMEFYEFFELGFTHEPIAVSSVHGSGTGDLLDAVLEALPDDAGEEEDDDSIKVAVIGKPNAGKSSIVNRMVGQERVIVSDIAGTTRDAIDTRVENQYGSFT
ncbi:MAG: 50S ribosome-binding GTPase, partial [Eubacteriales bacterium]|nr:50S ribosome-binding GTPase [Eubacteriales bacterium]